MHMFMHTHALDSSLMHKTITYIQKLTLRSQRVDPLLFLSGLIHNAFCMGAQTILLSEQKICIAYVSVIQSVGRSVCQPARRWSDCQLPSWLATCNFLFMLCASRLYNLSITMCGCVACVYAFEETERFPKKHK